MSSDRIAQLHEQASEHYLNGDYDGALQAWRDVLTLDPGNEQAMDGVRMAAQFAEPRSADSPAHPEVEHELDQGLKVLDSLGGLAAHDSGATMILNRRDVDGMIDQKPAPLVDPHAIEAMPLEAEAEPESEQAYGLDSISHRSPEQAETSAAAIELNRRVADLLAEARAKADAGERDEAIAILSRLAILDEDNAEALALRARLQDAGGSDLDKVESAIIEGVAALESERLDEAERLFREVLSLAPGHREAEYYLEKVQERRSGPGIVPGVIANDTEDLFGSDPLGDRVPATAPDVAAAHAEAVPLAAPKGPPHDIPRSAPRSGRAPSPEPLDAPVAPSRSRLKLPPLKWVLAGGLGAIALVCTAIALPYFTDGSLRKQPVTPPPPAARPSKPVPNTAPPAGVPAPAAVTPADKVKTVADQLAQGHAQMTDGDFGAAVVSFNEALRLDPANLEAKSAINQAAEAYKAHKAELETLESIRLAFRDGEYTSALRMTYRLPDSVPKRFTDGVKVAGWYNLAVVALRSGDCREALSHLDEALEVVPDDAESKKLREFSVRYSDAPKDRSFLDQVEAFTFRSLPTL